MPETTKIINGQNYELIISRNQLTNRYAELAQQIIKDYPDSFSKPPMLMGVITGGLFPLVDISRELSKKDFSYKVDTIGVTRYGDKKNPGNIRITKLPSGFITDENIILIEDVIEEGITINYIMNLLRLNNPTSIKILVSGWKKEISKLSFPIDYVGFELKPEWLIGEGMDDKQLVRGELGIWQKVA